MVYRCRVELVTLRDVADFVATINSVPYHVDLTNSDGSYVVSAKSMIGAIATVDWKDTWVVSDNSEVYNLVKKWAK